jgi:nitrite reductase/ring-hydroxylating ferredoxin subunit
MSGQDDGDGAGGGDAGDTTELADGEYVVAGAEEVGDGERVLVQLEGREVGVFNVDGELFAYTNWCAHQGGPCCEGRLTGTQEATYDRETRETTLEWTREDEVLNCPWHGWEYDVTSGECLSKNRIRLPEHDVEVRDDDIVVSL